MASLHCFSPHSFLAFSSSLLSNYLLMTSIPSLSLQRDHKSATTDNHIKMGSRRVELKLIENKTDREVTFAKGRDELLKKAYEMSVLCGAEVGLIIFSEHGRLYEFSSPYRMTKTLERYEEIVNSEPAPENFTFPESSLKSPWKIYSMEDPLQALLCFMRNLMGEHLGMLPKDNLEKLESQLESSLKHIREAKEQNVDVFGRLSRLPW